MLDLHISFDDQTRHLQVPDDSIAGKGTDCAIQLPGWNVSREHARFFRTDLGVLVEDLGGRGGVRVNGQLISEYGPLHESDLIEVGGHRLRVVSQPDGPLTDARTRDDVDVVLDDEPTAIGVPADALALDPRIAGECQRARSEDRSSAEVVDLGVTLRRNSLRRRTVPFQVHDVAHTMSGSPHALFTIGPLAALLADVSIDTIMVNAHDEVFVHREGRIERHAALFADAQEYRSAVEGFIACVPRSTSEPAAIFETCLEDRTRVKVMSSPMAVKGPALLILKCAQELLLNADLTDLGTPAMSEYLKACVAQRKNIVVSGGPLAGSTSLLNLLAHEVPLNERVVAIEDFQQLQLQHPHCIRLAMPLEEFRAAPRESAPDLIAFALELLPDRMLIDHRSGTCSMDVVSAMQHGGTIMTIRSGSCEEAAWRLASFMQRGAFEQYPVQRLVASTVNVFVQMIRLPSGARRISHICEPHGVRRGRIKWHDVFGMPQARAGVTA